MQIKYKYFDDTTKNWFYQIKPNQANITKNASEEKIKKNVLTTVNGINVNNFCNSIVFKNEIPKVFLLFLINFFFFFLIGNLNSHSLCFQFHCALQTYKLRVHKIITNWILFCSDFFFFIKKQQKFVFSLHLLSVTETICYGIHSCLLWSWKTCLNFNAFYCCMSNNRLAWLNLIYWKNMHIVFTIQLKLNIVILKCILYRSKWKINIH